MARVLRALLASGLLVFAIAVPALASTPLHQTGTIAFGDAPQGEDCPTVEDGLVLWHFVLTGTTALNSGDLTAVFVDSDGVEHTIVAQPSDGSSGPVTMWDITTSQDWSLVGDKTFTDADGDLLNLSHVCPGGPPPEVPEAPLALLLPLMALVTFGGYLLINRRRTA
jgi:hypothetical protein